MRGWEDLLEGWLIRGYTVYFACLIALYKCISESLIVNIGMIGGRSESQRFLFR